MRNSTLLCRRDLFDKYKYHILIFSTAGPVLNSNLQLYLDMKFFFAISVIEFPVLLGILRPTILASLFLTAESLNKGFFNVASTCFIACCMFAPFNSTNNSNNV